MFNNNNNNNNNKGFTLVELLVGIAVMGIVFVSVFGIFRMVINNSAISETRIIGTGLANQQMEMIRNLSYNNIGTTEGWPSGNIPSNQIKTINNVDYNIYTDVNYFDDAYDDLVPIDTLGADYKKVKVEINSDRLSGSSPIILFTDISPKGIEEAEQPGGVLAIQVFDYSNNLVPNAAININNSNLGISFNDATDNEGKRYFYALTPDSGANYEIQISKEGYTSDYTSEISVSLPDPDKPHQSVLEGQVTSISFIIDLTSNLEIYTTDNNEPPNSIGDIPLTFIGERRLGLDGENNPVPRNKFENQITDGSGQLLLNDIEWDNYSISDQDDNFDIADINPPDPIRLSPDETKTVTIKLANHENNTLRVIVLDSSDDPIEGASVSLFDGGGYDETKQTGASGQVFYSPIQPLTYNLEASKSGYIDFTDNVDVSGQSIRDVVMASQ